MADGTAIGVAGIERLPVDLLSSLLSRALTSPKDACACSALSTSFYAAAEADVVWSRFLPADIDDVLDAVDDPTLQHCSKKELFRRLCVRPVLFKGKRMSFGLANGSGAKKVMLAARSLWIFMADKTKYWRWYCHPESRFPEVAEFLCEDRSPDFSCVSRGSMLSSNTIYWAYLIFQLPDISYGINGAELEDERTMPTFIVINESDHDQIDVSLRQRPNQEYTSREWWNEVQFAEARTDGCMEVRIALFYNEGDYDEVYLRFLPCVEQLEGFIVEGIEVRPLLESNARGLCSA